jgi:hypothetical protein
MRRFYDSIVDEAGNIQVGAEMYVRDQGDNSLVALYSDDGSTTTANPVVSDASGYVDFYTADNTLKLEIYIDGELEKTIEQYQHFDLDNITSFAWTLLDDVNAAAARATLDLEPGTDVQAYDAGLAALAAFNTNGLLAQTADNTFAGRTITNGGLLTVTNGDGVAGNPTVAVDEATTAQVRANTADKVLSTDQTWAAGAYVALTDAATVDVDLATGINFSLTIGGNRTLGAPSNTKDGQAGEIIITQDGTGSRTLAYHANWKFAGGSDPVLSTAAGAIDVLSYKVVNSTFIIGSLSKAFS